MRKINSILFIGLVISIANMLIGYISWLYGYSIKFINYIGIIGYFGCWVFGFLSIILFFYGSIKYLTKVSNNFWTELYPLNFGLTILALFIIGNNPAQYSSEYILITLIIASFLALTFYKFKFVKYRIFLFSLIVLFILLFSGIFFKTHHANNYFVFALGMIFIVVFLINKLKNIIAG